MTLLQCGAHKVDLTRAAIMGILNVTPDSFSDGGAHADPVSAVARARQMMEEGVSIIDVGGESTRPGAQAVSVQEELDRVIPVVERIAKEIPVPISVDTSKPEVMRASIIAGAGLINDVYALRAPGALEAVAAFDVPICLTHMQGEPRTMQIEPHYTDVVAEVADFLAIRVKAAQAAGIARCRFIIDPGFGFGKTLEHNIALLRSLKVLGMLGLPVMAGLSRKSMIGKTLGLPIEQRLHASVALALIAVQNGARIVRVHDVAPTVQAVRMWEAIEADRRV